MFNLINLENVRQEMIDEVNRDIREGNVYISSRLNQKGRDYYAGTLLSSVTDGTPEVFYSNFGLDNFNSTEERKRPKGGFTTVQIPNNANITLCEGEFIRYYIRGVCLKAVSQNEKNVVAYRARHSDNPRRESVEMEGQQFDAQKLLNDLRTESYVDKAMGLPPGPNSGMCAKLLDS
ncbi:hypothetical protein [Marinagarivorans algicola]|uniref:hypothetical protein n=1 Tax=Marinagarivorans algicola TaxID=1513270 RepID=UPI0012E2291A|nr:hypothetical protein [Marinagarivorans algicola]